MSAATSLTWEQEEILRLRDEVFDLKEALAAALAGPKVPDCMLPIEWKLPRAQAAGLITLYHAKGPVTIAGLGKVMCPRARAATYPTVVRAQINRLRHATKDRGIVVHSRWGLGYELDPASRKVIAAALK